MFAPVFEETSSDYTDVTFVKVETESAPDVSQQFMIRSIPTIVFFKDGVEVERVSGFLQKGDLKSKIDSIKTNAGQNP